MSLHACSIEAHGADRQCVVLVRTVFL
jgi:hypothetical protein